MSSDELTPRVIVVMGVSGAGKTSLGRALASALGWRFEDGDDYHSEESVQKMSAGTPLNDDDREPWLRHLAGLVSEARQDEAGLVLACSALRQAYRETLGTADPGVALVHVTAPRDLLSARLEGRGGHFMPPALVDSQLEVLEPPEGAVTLDASAPLSDLVRQTRHELRL